MSEDTRVGTQPAGWRYDSRTGSTRWWDGASWTDHSKPLDPVVWTPPAKGMSAAEIRATTTTRNGPADAGLVLLLIAGVALVVGFWLSPGIAPATAAVLTFAEIALAGTAFVLSLVGLVVAFARPTRKREPVLGLVFSAVLLGFLAYAVTLGESAILSGLAA